MIIYLQHNSGKSSLNLSPVRSVVIIFTLTELTCLGPINFIKDIKLVKAIFLSSMPTLELSNCILKKARMPNNFGCK